MLKEPKVISITIGEKGIQWESGTIPVAVSPILAYRYVRSHKLQGMNVGRTLCHWSKEIGKARQRTSQKTCLCIIDLSPAGITGYNRTILLLFFLLYQANCTPRKSCTLSCTFWQSVCGWFIISQATFVIHLRRVGRLSRYPSARSIRTLAKIQ